MLIVLGMGVSANAADEVRIRVLGNYGNQPHSAEVEKPFFTKTLPDASGGRFAVEFRTVDEVGLKGNEIARLLEQGGFDIVAMQLGFVSGDIPFATGMDVPGMAADVEAYRRVMEVAKEPFGELLRSKYKGELLALWPYPAQIIFCNGPVSGTQDLKGKKIRVYSTALSQIVEGLGGIGVTVPFQEVYQALQRGVVDCAISGSIGGNSQKWFEVSTHLFNLPVGWGPVAHAANSDFWNGLSEEDRAVLKEQAAVLEDGLWALTKERDSDSVNCNTGGECKYGVKASMILVQPSQEDLKAVQEVVSKNILAAWAKDCSAVMPDCTKTWNATIGAEIGVSIAE